MHLLQKLYIVIIVVLITFEVGATMASTHDRLIVALMEVESHCNDNAIGDRHMHEKAFGVLQIRKPCVDDVNRHFGTKIQAQELLGNRSLSVWVCRKYLETYATPTRLGRKPTMEDMARI